MNMNAKEVQTNMLAECAHIEARCCVEAVLYGDFSAARLRAVTAKEFENELARRAGEMLSA